NPSSNNHQSKLHFQNSYPALDGKKVVLSLGRLHPIKRCDLLIKAFSRCVKEYPNLHLIMAGPDVGAVANDLKKLASNLRVEADITWTGMLNSDEKWGAIAVADAFCLPSHHENFGIVVAEALACGKPVLISNKINIWREIESDNAGFVAEDTVDG